MLVMNFLISLTGATMLLLFAVRLVRTGIERSYDASFQRVMTGQDRPMQASLVGGAPAFLMHSLVAVILICVTLVHIGAIPSNVHIAFNAALLLLALPFCNLLRGPFEAFLPDYPKNADLQVLSRPQIALDPTNIGSPTQALASPKRELLRMTELVEAMFHPVMVLYGSGDKDHIRAVQSIDCEVNACLTRIRAFVAGLPIEVMADESGRAARDMLEYAVRLETAGDVESARLLNMEKTEIKRAERDSRKRHFRRLQSGKKLSFASSDIHLETLRAFRDFNSNIAAVATPILYANGQLLETRLIEEMPRRERDD